MEIERLLEIARDIHERAYQLGYKHGQQSANINRAARVGGLIEVRMPSGKTKRLRIVDKDASEVGEDECLLHSVAVLRGRVVEEGEE